MNTLRDELPRISSINCQVLGGSETLLSLDRWAVAGTARSPRAFSSTTMWHDARIPDLLKERFGSHFACVIEK
jgi:hypothetical protein